MEFVEHTNCSVVYIVKCLMQTVLIVGSIPLFPTLCKPCNWANEWYWCILINLLKITVVYSIVYFNTIGKWIFNVNPKCEAHATLHHPLMSTLSIKQCRTFIDAQFHAILDWILCIAKVVDRIKNDDKQKTLTSYQETLNGTIFDFDREKCTDIK